MRVLQYQGLNISRGEAAFFRRIVTAIEQDDFRAADVKKLVGPNHGNSTAQNSMTPTACSSLWCVTVMKFAQ